MYLFVVIATITIRCLLSKNLIRVFEQYQMATTTSAHRKKTHCDTFAPTKEMRRDK